MIRFSLIALTSTLVVVAAITGAMVSQGVDPLAPQVRTIALVSLAAAVYVGLRVAMVANRMLASRDDAGDEGGSTRRRRSAFARWGRSDTLDARMEARRERVARARDRKAGGDN